MAPVPEPRPGPARLAGPAGAGSPAVPAGWRLPPGREATLAFQSHVTVHLHVPHEEFRPGQAVTVTQPYRLVRTRPCRAKRGVPSRPWPPAALSRATKCQILLPRSARRVKT